MSDLDIQKLFTDEPCTICGRNEPWPYIAFDERVPWASSRPEDVAAVMPSSKVRGNDLSLDALRKADVKYEVACPRCYRLGKSKRGNGGGWRAFKHLPADDFLPLVSSELSCPADRAIGTIKDSVGYAVANSSEFKLKKNETFQGTMHAVMMMYIRYQHYTIDCDQVYRLYVDVMTNHIPSGGQVAAGLDLKVRANLGSWNSPCAAPVHVTGINFKRRLRIFYHLFNTLSLFGDRLASHGRQENLAASGGNA